MLLSVYFTNGQGHFVFNNPKKEKIEIPFDLNSNLIIIRVKINKIPLNLVLDTGVKETILINLHQKKDSLKFTKIKKKLFVGTGNEKQKIEAIQASGNTISIDDKIINKHSDVFIITNKDFGFSETLGIPIFGFIGGNLLKDFIVKIDYQKKILTFYKNKKNIRKKLKRYRDIHIKIRRGKPFMKASVQFAKNQKKDSLNLLIDTGNSDALWLFENKNFHRPNNQKSIPDFLGLGLNGEVTGERIKLYRFFIDEYYKLKDIYTAFPDQKYYHKLIEINKFDGIIGSEILQRFKIFLDYKNKNIYLRKNCLKYYENFRFNDSGMHLTYAEKIPVAFKKIHTKLEEEKNLNSTTNNPAIYTETEIVYDYKFVNKIIINYIRPGSPAEKAGFKKGDVLIKINGENIYKYKLEALEKKFFYKTGKNLHFLILRNQAPLELELHNKSQF